MAVRISKEETSCTHKASDNVTVLRPNHAIHCYVAYWYVLVFKIISEIYHFNFEYLSSGHSIYLSKQGCEDPWLFFGSTRSPRGNTFGKHWSIGTILYGQVTAFCTVTASSTYISVPTEFGWLKE
jgi:hypothetical protein